jgi:lipopolysaccharide biosynthesis glycosyltransferase
MLLLRNHGPTLRKIREQVQLSQARATDRADLANIPNFARNWADELLLPTGVDKVIYLDADTIVKVRAASTLSHSQPITLKLKRSRGGSVDSEWKKSPNL